MSAATTSGSSPPSPTGDTGSHPRGAYHRRRRLGYFSPVIFDPPPKSRRRAVARFLWPALVATAVIVAVVVSAAGEETRVELEYLEEIRVQVEELARSGSSIADVMTRVDQVDRNEFTTAFEGVTSDLDVAVSFVGSEPPVESLIPVWSLYRQAVHAWDRGVEALGTAILQAADDPDDLTVLDITANALADLRAGDALYRDLQVEFEQEGVPAPVSPLAAVTMSPGDAGLASQAMSYVTAARRSTAGLGLRAGLKVSQVVSEPEWQMNVENQAVVPATDTVVVSAVITNSGNIASETESVRLTFQGGAEPVVAEEEVPPLQPNGQTTIEFNELDVVPDTLYEVLVELQLTNPDADLTDNMQRVQFTVTAG